MSLGKSNIGNTFGAAGFLALIMIWIYYSAQILFLGAEFTQVYTEYDPQGMVHVMEILQEASQGNQPLKFFSTHPNPQNRIERIQANIHLLDAVLDQS